MRHSILIPIRNLEPERDTPVHGFFNPGDIHSCIVTAPGPADNTANDQGSPTAAGPAFSVSGRATGRSKV
jgi:hypothetical protein